VRVITLPEFNILNWKKYAEIVIPIEEGNVYGILAAPPCTEFSKAKGNLPRDFKGAMEVVNACLQIIWTARINHKLQFWALENPMGFLRQFLGNPPYNFEPWMFGDLHTKNTDLWGYFNKPRKKYTTMPPLLANETSKTGKTHAQALSVPYYPPEYKHLKLNRAALRAITPQGFAKAFMEANL